MVRALKALSARERGGVEASERAGRVSGSEKLLLSEQPYLFCHWGARLAFLRPYFLRSTTRASRVR